MAQISPKQSFSPEPGLPALEQKLDMATHLQPSTAQCLYTCFQHPRLSKLLKDLPSNNQFHCQRSWPVPKKRAASAPPPAGKWPCSRWRPPRSKINSVDPLPTSSFTDAHRYIPTPSSAIHRTGGVRKSYLDTREDQAHNLWSEAMGSRAARTGLREPSSSAPAVARERRCS